MSNWEPCAKCKPANFPLANYYNICKKCQQDRLAKRGPILQDRGYRAHLTRRVLGIACLTQCPESPREHASFRHDALSLFLVNEYNSLIEWASKQFERPWDDNHVTAFEVLAGQYEVEEIQYCGACLESAEAKFEVNELIQLCDLCLTMRKAHIEHAFGNQHDFHEPWEQLQLKIAFPDETLKSPGELGYDKLIEHYFLQKTFGGSALDIIQVVLTAVLALPTPIILALTLRHTEMHNNRTYQLASRRDPELGLGDDDKREINEKIDNLTGTVETRRQENVAAMTQITGRVQGLENTVETWRQENDAARLQMAERISQLEIERNRKNDEIRNALREIKERYEQLESRGNISRDLHEAPDMKAKVERVQRMLKAEEDDEEDGSQGGPSEPMAFLQEIESILRVKSQNHNERTRKSAEELLETVKRWNLKSQNKEEQLQATVAGQHRQELEQQVDSQASTVESKMAITFVRALLEQNVKGGDREEFLDLLFEVISQFLLRQYKGAEWRKDGASSGGSTTQRQFDSGDGPSPGSSRKS
jgi:hypothetical protein